MAGTTGTPKAVALGLRLRDVRKAAGYSVRGLADQLGISHSALSRWETGARKIQSEDVAILLGALGVNGDQRAEILELARGLDAPQWLSVRSADRDRQMAALVDFEHAATQITDVSPLLIPGLLQTADYARAIMVAGGVSPDQIETRVLVRVGRREVLTRRNPAQLLVLICDAALNQQIGGKEVMRDQLQHLKEFAERPNVVVRVVPASAGWSPAHAGPFVLLDFADTDKPAIVHLENRTAGIFFHEAQDVEVYQHAVGRLKELAMSPEVSAELIADVITELETT